MISKIERLMHLKPKLFMKGTAMNYRYHRFRGFKIRLVLYLCTMFLTIFILASTGATQEQHKYAVALFHCNVQYVAGGTLGMLPLPFLLGWFPNWELDSDATEDMIIKQGFEPMLDLYLAHPNWGVDIEFQAYYVEVLAQRHPTVLNKLITLVEQGQAEIISFHYSDQLFIGFGRPAWEKSVEETKRVFEENDVPLSDVVFTQEGQAGMGMAQAMEEHGYAHLVWPKNLWKYQHGDWESAAYYKFGNLDMIPGPKDINYNSGQLQLTWTFLDDGELMAACHVDPYFPPFFKTSESCIREYESEVEQLEADGWKISTIGEYFHAAKDMGITPTEPPPLFDGTWQPKDTDGVHRWLGGKGIIPFNADDERDNHVRTLNEIAYRELMAAQTIAKAAGLQADDELDDLWHLLNLGMVTDASGINPIGGEIGYSIAHSGEVARSARLIIEQGKEALGLSDAIIDTEAESVIAGTAPDEPPVADEAPINVNIDPGWRQASSTWYRVSDNPEIWRLDITVNAGIYRSMAVTFPGDSSKVIFTPALADDMPVSYNRSDFAFDHWWLALANGMINISDDMFVIKDMGLTHVAALIYPDSEDVTFRDDVATPNSAFQWRFYLLRGTADDAVAFANSLNVYPTLYR